MTNINHRRFIGTALVAAGGLALSGALSAKAASGGIEILVNEPIGRIAPEIYGHFVEHLGAVVYDGIWVGEGSKIPISAASANLSRRYEAHQGAGYPLSRRLFCRQLRLARRCRFALETPAQDEFLVWCGE